MTCSKEKKYRVDYTTTKGKETFTIMMIGTSIDDVKDRFDRCSKILASNDEEYAASIVTISECSKSQEKRYAAQGMPGA